MNTKSRNLASGKPKTDPPLSGFQGTRVSLLSVVVCATVLAVGAVFFVWQRYQYIRLGFEVAELRREKAQLEMLIEPLAVEVEYLSRLERIDGIARGKLGMRPPKPGQVTILE